MSQRGDWKIREILPRSEEEVSLVASRMRETLVEVLGREQGESLYSLEWLHQRVRWHLDPTQTKAKVFLAESAQGIAGHAIARIDLDESGEPFGYFSTLYVEPGSRRKGLADLLVKHVESWLRSLAMPSVV